MGVLSDRALRLVHAGLTRRTFEFAIEGVPFTDQVRQLSVDFDPTGGGSACQIETKDSLEGLEDARVELRLGYGDTDDIYFVGYLQEPGDLRVGKGTAYGPFKLMSDQYLGEEVRYQGVSIATIFRDLEYRAGYTTGQIDVVGGSTIAENLFYTENTSLSEVAKAVADPVKYVFYDRPGYRRKVMSTPLTGVGGTMKAIYTERNYPNGGFSVKETRTGHYSKVVVMRTDDSVSAEIPVSPQGKFKPPANRIYYITDFPGDDTAAKQMAYEQASKIAFGEYEWSLNGIWINPELEPWDAIT